MVLLIQINQEHILEHLAEDINNREKTQQAFKSKKEKTILVRSNEETCSILEAKTKTKHAKPIPGEGNTEIKPC